MSRRPRAAAHPNGQCARPAHARPRSDSRSPCGVRVAHTAGLQSSTALHHVVVPAARVRTRLLLRSAKAFGDSTSETIESFSVLLPLVYLRTHQGWRGHTDASVTPGNAAAQS